MDDIVTVTLTREQYDWIKGVSLDNIKKYYEIWSEDGEEAVKYFHNIVRIAKSVMELQPNQ
jgi:hypothetical protein